jgi:hypothetical protein
MERGGGGEEELIPRNLNSRFTIISARPQMSRLLLVTAAGFGCGIGLLLARNRYEDMLASASRAHEVLALLEVEMVAENLQLREEAKTAAAALTAARTKAEGAKKMIVEPMTEAGAVTVVAQRCNSAKLLVDNDSNFVSCPRGVLFFVSFAEGTTPAKLGEAAKALLSLPLATLGAWYATSPHHKQPRHTWHLLLALLQSCADVQHKNSIFLGETTPSPSLY